MRRLTTIVATTLLTVTVVLAGCTTEEAGTQTPAGAGTATADVTPTAIPTATPTAIPALTASEVLDKVNAAMDTVESFHLGGEMVVQETATADAHLFTADMSGMGNVGGDWQMGVELNFNVGAIAATMNTETRVIDGTFYVKNPATGTWAAGDADLLGDTGSFFEESGNPFALEDPQIELTTLNGKDVYKITGTDSASTFGSAVAFSAQQTTPEVTVTTWAAVEDFRVIRMQATGMMPADDSQEMVPEGVEEVYMSITMDFSNYDEPVEVHVPEGVEGTLEPPGTIQPTDSPAAAAR